jgi:hypothetical protein
MYRDEIGRKRSPGSALNKTKDHCFSRSKMNRKCIARCFSTLLLGGACLSAGLAISVLISAPAKAQDKPAETKPANVTSIKGTCTFMGQQGTWSAKLTPTETPGVYDAQYVAAFAMGGNNMTYVGQIKSDFKMTISGGGKSTGGGGNGTFEFSGNYSDDGIARCNYTEVGGQRSGTLTAEKPE